jgi:succinoglycan biosynthesis transport protein ExoP
MHDFDQRSTALRSHSGNAGAGNGGAPFIEMLEGGLRTIRRQLPIVIAVFACCLTLATLYYFTATRSYTAAGTMLLDTRKVQLLEKESVLGDIQLDASTVQTQVEVLKSENISLAVIRKLRLAEDPEFNGTQPGLFGTIMGVVRTLARFGKPAKPFTASELETAVLDAFEDRRTISRLGLTYAIEVSFTSQDPEKSARIVNTLVESYLADQIDAKYQAARRAGIWLLQRIKELREQSTTASRAVAEFKEKNNIVDTGGGKLMTEQQVSEIASQLIIARAAVAEVKARLQRIRAVMNSPNIADEAVPDTLRSEVIIKVRGRYLDLAQREAFLAQKYGETHLATVNLRTQMQELKRNIADEMAKIAQSYESEYEIATSREESLEASLHSVVTEAQTGGQAKVQLLELEANKETATAIYDTFRNRYMEASQQKDAMPVSEARLISPATAPLQKSAPKGGITFLVAAAIGSVLGFGVAFLREATDRALRTADQVERTLRTACIAVVPALEASMPSGADIATLDDGSHPVEDQTAGTQDFLHKVVDTPFSRYTEAIRAIKVAADINGALKAPRIIGVTSTLPDEGKTTIASNLAHLIADTGARAVLVDADLRCPSLTTAFAPGTPGLVDVVLGKVALESALVELPSSPNLAFLGAGTTAKLVHTNEILASAAMKQLMEALRARYAYIVVDLPPVAPIVDVRATGHVIDTYVFVVEWGKTRLEHIQRSLGGAPNVYDQMLGVVLNKVDLSAQCRYECGNSDRQFQKYYAKYGYVD